MNSLKSFFNVLLLSVIVVFTTFSQQNPAHNVSIVSLSSTAKETVLSATTEIASKELTYQWLQGISPIAGATQSSYTATESGFYTVKIKHEDFESASKPFEVNIVKEKKTVSTNPTVNVACDPYEPNNTAATATPITGTAATLTGMCFEFASDDDWFVWTVFGKTYYIKAYTFAHAETGAYTATFSTTGTTFKISLSSYNGSAVDTYLQLYDSNGTTLLDYDDDGGLSFFSELSFDTNQTIYNYSISPNLFCNGASFFMYGDVTGSFGITNVFTYQLSDQNGSFASPTVLGTVSGNYPNATQRVTLPANLPASANYLVRIVSTIPVKTSTTRPIVISSTTLPISITPAAPATFCPGDSVTLTASGAYSSYQWNAYYSSPITGATTNTLKVKSSGNYSVRASNGTCSNYSSTVTVSTYSKPSITVTASPSTIPTPGQSTTVTVSYCYGTINGSWKYLDNSGNGTFTTASFTHTPAKSVVYSAICTSTDNCKGDTVVAIVLVNEACDLFEPNETPATATLISGNNFESQRLCFDVAADQDWFKWIYNGKAYYIKAVPYSGGSLGKYKLKLNLVGGVLTIKTEPYYFSNLDTKLYLYDSDGTTQLGYNDDYSENGTFYRWSKITYTSALLNCQNILAINQTIGNGVSKHTAIQRINATNIVNPTAKVDYQSNTIELQPGFTANTGSVFTAKVGGCI